MRSPVVKRATANDPLFLRDEVLRAAARRLRAAAAALDRASGEAAARLCEEEGGEIGEISLADLRFLEAIADGVASGPSALARRFGWSRQAASKRARKLLDAGLLVEIESAGGARALAPSPDARRRIAAAAAAERRAMRAAFAAAGPEAKQGFETVLAALEDDASGDAPPTARRYSWS